MQQTVKFGIYLNLLSNEIVRINSPYWIPPEPDWVLVTSEVNATLIQIRDLVRERGLVSSSDSVVWGRIPLQD